MMEAERCSYVLKALSNGSYVQGLHTDFGCVGFIRTYDINYAKGFSTIADLLQFVSSHHHPNAISCGKYEIIRVQQAGWSECGRVE